MKTRILHTEFWKKMEKHNAPIHVRLLYSYLMTNMHINMTGVYELTDNYMLLETGLTNTQLKDAKIWLSDKGKVFFYDGWVKVVDAENYNNYKNSPKTKENYKKEEQDVPKGVLDWFNKQIDTGIVVVSVTADTNHKSESINKKTETIKPKEEKTSKNSHIACTEDELKDISQKLTIHINDVRKKHDSIFEQFEAGQINKTKYKTMYWTLKSWLDLDLKKGYIKNWKPKVYEPATFTPPPAISEEQRLRNMERIAEMKRVHKLN